MRRKEIKIENQKTISQSEKFFGENRLKTSAKFERAKGRAYFNVLKQPQEKQTFLEKVKSAFKPKKKQEPQKPVERFEPQLETGLTEEQVKARINDKLTNLQKPIFRFLSKTFSHS